MSPYALVALIGSPRRGPNCRIERQPQLLAPRLTIAEIVMAGPPPVNVRRLGYLGTRGRANTDRKDAIQPPICAHPIPIWLRRAVSSRGKNRSKNLHPMRAQPVILSSSIIRSKTQVFHSPEHQDDKFPKAKPIPCYNPPIRGRCGDRVPTDFISG